jgi:hypothetical protein
MAQNNLPPLGPGSVNLSELSAALAKKGADPVKAIEAATTPSARPAKAEEAPAAPPASLSDPA